MKFGLILLTLLIAQSGFAQSMREKRIKEEMLQRVATLLHKIDDTRNDLDREDVVNACSKIKEMFVIYPDHVKAIGSHMSLFEGRTVDAKNEALTQLIFMHKQTLLCDQGTDCEYVDPKQLSKELKKIGKSLKKQGKTIKKSDTGYDNTFYYHYEF